MFSFVLNRNPRTVRLLDMELIIRYTLANDADARTVNADCVPLMIRFNAFAVQIKIKVLGRLKAAMRQPIFYNSYYRYLLQKNNVVILSRHVCNLGISSFGSFGMEEFY